MGLFSVLVGSATSLPDGVVVHDNLGCELVFMLGQQGDASNPRAKTTGAADLR